MLFFKKTTAYLKSFCKINVLLKIVRKRDDGYHELEMVNLPLELHDAIEISLFPNSEDTFVTTDDIALGSLHENLCEKSVKALQKAFGFQDNFNIKIHKEIPFAAGLGGGSSNAAAVIRGVNDLLKLKASQEKLLQIAKAIGADVPFFFYNVPALVTGIGENITPIYPKNSYYCLLVKPKRGLHTVDVFNLSDSCPKLEIDAQRMIDALESGDEDAIAAALGNDLLTPALQLAPEIGDIIKKLKGFGLKIVNMTGSGSTVFALSNDLKKLKEAAKKIDNDDVTVIITRTLSL